MKNRLPNPARFISAALCLLCFLLANDAGATTLYWDPDGLTQNGSTGTWDTTSLQWSPFTSLQPSPVAWNTADAACFCAGNYTAALTITVTNAITMAGIYNGTLTPGCNLTISGTGSLNIASGITAALSTAAGAGTNTYVYVPFTGPGTLNPQGSGNCYLYGTNTHSGGTTLAQTGILYFTNAAAFGSGPITMSASGSGGALLLNESDYSVNVTNTFNCASARLNIVGNPLGLTFSGPWNLGTARPTIGTGNTPGNLIVISGVMSGSGGLNVFNYGTLELTAANTFNGGVSNSTATLQLGDGVSHNGVITGNITNNATLIFVNPTAQTYSFALDGIISGTGTLTKQAAGVLTLKGPNTYTGVTTLSAGTLQVNNAETPGTSGPLGSSPAANPGSIVLSGGTLQFSSLNHNDYSGRFSTGANQAYNIDVNGQTVTFATALTSSGGSLTLSSTTAGGKLTLSAANTYNGGTTVNSGTLDAAVNGALGSGNVTVASGATLELDANGALNSGAELILSPGAHVFLNYSGTNTIHAISLDGGATTAAAGTYGLGANNPNSAFTGAGYLNVTTGSVATTNAILSVTANGGNSFTLNLLGVYQAQYYLVSQTNVAQPMANWKPVPGSTNTVTSPSGLWSVTVTNPPPAFYRVRAM